MFLMDRHRWFQCTVISCCGISLIGICLAKVSAQGTSSSTQSTATPSPPLKTLAFNQGFKFGFSLAELNPFVFDSSYQHIDAIVRSDASVATMTAYWHLPNWNIDGGPVVGYDNSKIGVGKTRYKFEYQDAIQKFCIDRGLELHGHTLVWGQDLYSPPWVLSAPLTSASALMVEHVSTVVTRFKGKVKVWHVVNEAFEVDGKLINSHWSRAMGAGFIGKAFQAAATADPTASLIYNEIGMEAIDGRKFNAALAMLSNLQAQKIPIHGVGWQLHLSARQVLDPNFPLEPRLRQIAALGLDNYVTELDIVVSDRNSAGVLPVPVHSAENLELQRQAYKKIAQIFARTPHHKAMQTWGISDDRSWLGANQFPLLYDSLHQRKPAYFGLQDGLLPGNQW